MLIVTFGDGTSYEALENTTVFPSGSASVRAYMELHMAEDAMPIDEFEELLSDESKTCSMTFTKTDDEGGIIYEETFENFVVLAEVGKKIITAISNETGQTTQEWHLVARLEQLTEVEQQLQDLEIIDILLGGED